VFIYSNDISLTTNSYVITEIISFIDSSNGFMFIKGISTYL